MTAIFIRLKSLLIFGIVLLSISFLWLGFWGFDRYKEAIGWGEKSPEGETVAAPEAGSFPQDTTPDNSQPTVTIVPQEQQQVKGDNFFNEYRIERERTRSERVEILREIVSNPNSSAQMRQEAQQKLIAISDNLEKESKAENGLIAKGFKNALVVIQNPSVMVIVPSNGLRQDEIARIADIVVKIVGCRMEDVVIVPKVE